ncbi:response regulator transcription factor [Amycolatopsis magusensis]|uniref:DNA-binding NarL/FixJ family response regulator n=1 Tax=Amycolatopsis magusensis TaxID=882444 RepID=A0ABS4PZQ5_9PSEU|nr:response regulator transcription factor [Amycolatopsis magusensis]MBP2184909.1 DNA-binding NarL/FixJ family response regulator [Amycolatopsis magusensis]MDI5976685.1 response regulator transcription factor [Amycolatopsis magusensis]
MRVVIGEDQFLLRDGLVRLLEAHEFEIAAAVGSGPDLLEALVGERPDVAVVDIRLPPSFTDEGLRAAIEARRRIRGLPVLVLSQYVERLYANELLADGVGSVGYLLKDRVFDGDQFIDAVRQVATGGTVMDPEVISRLLNHNTRDAGLDSLTARERDVLKLMAEGRSNSSIAGALFVSEKAVSKHINNILAKLHLPQSEDDNRRVLAVLAYLKH